MLSLDISKVQGLVLGHSAGLRYVSAPWVWPRFYLSTKYMSYFCQMFIGSHIRTSYQLRLCRRSGCYNNVGMSDLDRSYQRREDTRRRLERAIQPQGSQKYWSGLVPYGIVCSPSGHDNG